MSMGSLRLSFLHHLIHAFPNMRRYQTPAQRVELVRNRCFITTDLPSGDLWPFDDFFIEARA